MDLDAARQVLEIEADAIRRQIDGLGETFSRAIEAIEGSKGRLCVTGIGKSGLVGQKIAATLASTGTPAYFLHAGDASHGDLGMAREPCSTPTPDASSTRRAASLRT